MTTYLVTGASGQMGSVLIKKLLYNTNNVVLAMNRRSARKNWRWELLEFNPELCKPHFIEVSGDLSDQTSLDNIFMKYPIDVVFNCGAQSYVAESWKSPESTIDITGIGPVRIYEAARKFRPNCKIIQCSSSEMFGAENRTIILNEASTFQPRSPYAAAKILAHNMAKVYRESYSMHIACAIMFNYESYLRGPEFVTQKIAMGVAKCVENPDFKVRLGSLHSKRDWGSCFDYADALILMSRQSYPEDYVLATGKNYSVEDFCRNAFNVAGLDWEYFVRTDPSLTRPADVYCLLGDNSKAIRELGWHPQENFFDIVESMVEFALKTKGSLYAD